MKTRKVYSFVAFLIFLVAILSVYAEVSKGSEEKSLRFDPSFVNITLSVNQKKEESVQVINDSSLLVHFSLFKSAQEEMQVDTASLQRLPEEEYGSSWLTYKCNYQRQSCNPIESSIPPYAYKWSYQANNPLLSPVVSGNSLIIPSEDGYIYIIDSRTGVFRNRLNLDNPIISVHLQGTYLVIATSIEIVVYNRTTQVYLWRKPLEFSSLASVCLHKEIIYYLNGSYLVSANIATGNENWKITNSDSSLILTDDSIISSNEEHIFAYNITSGQLLWRVEGLNLVDMPAELNQHIYFIHRDSKNAYISSTKLDGSEEWKQTIPFADVNYFAVQQSHIVVTTVSGNIICLDRKSGIQKWSYINQSKIHISPVIAADLVYVGSNVGRLFAMNIENGSLVWQTNTGFPIYNPIIIAKGFIYITDAVQTLYAYGREWENVIPPEPPDQVKAISGDKVVTLFWRHSKQTPDFAGYHIYRKTSNELEYSFIASIGIINQYQDTALRNKQAYHYIVRSFDTFGNESTNSNMVSVMPDESHDPGWFLFNPTGGTINPSRRFTIDLQFYTKDLLPGDYKGFLQCLYTDEDLQTNYISLPITLHLLEKNEILLPLPKISSIESSDSRVILKWDPIPSAKTYLIYRSIVKNDELKLINSVPSSTLTYQDDQVSNNKTYYYYLKYQTDQNQTSDFSLEATITPKPLPIEILYPTTPTLYEPVFTISGQADPKAKVFFQKWPVSIDTDGRFSTSAGIHLGWNKLVFLAIDTEGKSQEAVLEVQFITSYLRIELFIGSSIVSVNGKTWPYLLDAPPVIQNNRTFVPLRFISEVIGATVEWTAKEQRIDIIKGSQHIILWIGKTQARLNNTIIELESAPFLVNNRTMVPLRFITEPLGAELQWDALKQAITLLFKA